MKHYIAASLLVTLCACGGGEVKKIDEPLGYDTTEMISGGQGVEGPVSGKFHPSLDGIDIPVIDPAIFSREAAEPIGLVQYETSRQSKARIKTYLLSQIPDKNGYTFQNGGSRGINTYISQGLFITEGKISGYEVKAIFVRNEDGIMMLHDYGLRWQCRDSPLPTWTIKPC